VNWFVLVKRYYDDGRYTKADVAVFVVAGKITEQQYAEITGQVYEASA